MQRELIRHIVKNNGILVTSYNTLVIHQEHLLVYDWHYIILDEGHKIRNPDVQATLVCKQVVALVIKLHNFNISLGSTFYTVFLSTSLQSNYKATNKDGFQ